MKVGICSLGCKVNIYESEFVEQLLKNHGYEIVPFDSNADIYIINTCSVTNESDKKSRKMIRQARRRNSDSVVVVMGCYSQVKSDEISSDDADIILGNRDKSMIIELLDEFFQSHDLIKRVYNLRDDSFFEKMFIDDFENHTRAFVKIQDGCDAFCSYCIIPYTRGKVRSKPLKDVVQEVTSLVNNGYKEIVLTGIHTGRYGVDLDNVNLEKLLKELVKIPNIYRIRLSSIEINEITDGIMDLIKNNSIIASHFHIPLQSGCNRILKLMNRKYCVDDFIKKIEKIRALREDISITTDLIVGFPGETDNDFKETIDTLNKICFTKIHTFPYSKRDGTVASQMLDQVDGITKKKRVKEIIDLSMNFEKKYYLGFIGKIMDGVTEVRKDGSVLVHTTNYIPIFISDMVANNEIVSVKITSVSDNNEVYGELVNLKKSV